MTLMLILIFSMFLPFIPDEPSSSSSGRKDPTDDESVRPSPDHTYVSSMYYYSIFGEFLLLFRRKIHRTCLRQQGFAYFCIE